MFHKAILLNKSTKGVTTQPTQVTPDEKLSKNSNPHLDKDDMQQRLTYWVNLLSELNPAEIPSDATFNKLTAYKANRIPFTLDSTLTGALEKSANELNITLDVFLATTLYTLLYRYHNEEDICIGIVPAIKPDNDNTTDNIIPLRMRFSKRASFEVLAKQTNLALNEALANEIPFNLILNNVLTKENREALATTSLFSALLMVNKKQKNSTTVDLQTNQLNQSAFAECKFPNIGLYLSKTSDKTYCGFIEYNAELFKASTIQRFIDRYLKMLASYSTNYHRNPNAVSILLAEELEGITQLNKTTSTITLPTFVHDQFHQIALARPNQTAVTFHHEKNAATVINYRDLDLQSTQLANYLKSIGIRAQDRIGIALPRSISLIIATLAVLKAGAVMVAMETDDVEKIDKKYNENKVKLILTDESATAFSKNANEYALLNLNTIETKNAINQSDNNYQSPALNIQDPAYVMYTSGSHDGNPVGALNTHRALINLAQTLAQKNITPQSKILCSAPPTFDAWLFDLVVMLVTQGELHFIYDQGRYLPSVITDIVTKYDINYAVCLPEVLKGLDPTTLPLIHVISMGEVPHIETMQKWISAGKQIENGYGLTETGICLSFNTYNPTERVTLIGKPITNTQFYILNSDDAICPLGVPGEIFVAGDGLALQYVAAPDLTRAKFLNVVYHNELQRFFPAEPTDLSAIRLYKTGDWGCYQPCESGLKVDFLGRKDRQIKLQGVRIDINNVETILSKHPDIKEVVVTTNPNNTALLAYIIPFDKKLVTKDNIDKFLAKTTLPKVAYPATVTTLAAFPLTKNGKIDTKALLHMNTSLSAPTTELQNDLRKIWADVLGLHEQAIAINVSFTALGGTSLGFAQLETKLTTYLKNHRQSLNMPSNLVLPELLKNDMTIISLAELLRKKSVKSHVLIQLPRFGGGSNMFPPASSLNPSTQKTHGPLKFNQK